MLGGLHVIVDILEISFVAARELKHFSTPSLLDDVSGKPKLPAFEKGSMYIS